MNSKPIISKLITTLRDTSAFFGLIPSACIALFMIITAGSLISTGSVQQKKLGTFATQTLQQLTFTESMNTRAVSIRLAIMSEDWDALTSINEQLTQCREQWTLNHDNLRINALHHQSISASIPTQQDETETITELFDRIEYQRRKIDDASSELSSLTQNVIRRAPYIDELTMSRIESASSTITSHTPEFSSIMNLINQAVTDYAAQKSAAGVSRVRFWDLLSFAAFTLTIIIGFAPKIWNAKCDIRQLHDDLDQSNEEHTNHWRDITSISQSLSAPLQQFGAVANDADNTDQPDPDCIARTASVLLTMTQDLETLSRSYTGSIDLELQSVNPMDLFSRLIDQYDPMVTKQGLRFEPQIGDQLPATFTTDPAQLIRVVSKVLDNAIQHTTQGTIELHISYEPPAPDHDGQDHLCIRIVDSGPGISPKALSTIFEPFNRESNNPTPSRTGIGLPLARMLSRQLGGDLTIESAQGAGTYVTITIATQCTNETVTFEKSVSLTKQSNKPSQTNESKYAA